MKRMKNLVANNFRGENIETNITDNRCSTGINRNKEEQGVFEKEKIVTNINNVIEKAINEDIPVVFIRDLDVSHGEGPGFQIHRDIKVPSTAIIFDKAATNSFYGTPLHEHLSENKVDHIVLVYSRR
ncbi:isochorismatase family protein [Peribacillus frigoritolerans]|uniref:isochorismatase family protein n=1 Tax=Peribacillus frigoritolerans TaxID=450367 RepID=UPI00292D8F3D|nr:isochorismatase family protein [Peribacillus frigoritolerans]